MSSVRFFVCSATVLLSFGGGRAQAWGPVGHQLVAEVAYQQMGLEERARAVKILKDAFGDNGLQRFEKDLTHGLPNDASAADRDHLIFLRAAIWPDIVRDESHPLHDQHKPDWHFINLPFVPEGEDVAPPKTPKGEILNAIALCLKEIKAPETSKNDRAVRLCFLLHMYGDIVQPLHAAAMFSKPKLLHGDQGGNEMLLRIPGDSPDHDTVTSIHSIFDGIFGNDSRLKSLVLAAERITHRSDATPAALSALRAQKDSMEWAKESLAEAIKFAYLDGKLNALRGMTFKQFNTQLEKAAKPILVSDVPAIPADYEKNALSVSEKRVALGGYRLADALTELFAASP